MKIRLKSKSIAPSCSSAHGLRVMLGLAEEQGIETASILADIGLKKADLDNPDTWIIPEKEMEIRENISNISSDAALGLHIGQRSHMGEYGKWIMAANSSATGIDALKTIFALIDLVGSPFQYILEVNGDIAIISLREIMEISSCRPFNYEWNIVGGYSIFCELLRERIALKEARFAYPRPKYADEYKKIFNCPIIFDAEETQVLFDSRYLTRRMPCANTLTKKIYEKDCLQTIEQISKSTTTIELAKLMLHFKNVGFLTRVQLARRMNMGSKTLQRRLLAEGETYKSLVRGIRQTKACDLLLSTELSIEEIAYNLGYSNVANFYRAFKSWTGTTPIIYRIKNKPKVQPRGNRA